MTAVRNDKDYDCVAFKDEAQAAIYEETKGLSRSELTEYFRRRVEEGPFAQLWRAARRAGSGQGMP